MTARPASRTPGIRLVLVLLVAGIAVTAWLRLSRPVVVDPDGAPRTAPSSCLPELVIDFNRADAAGLGLLPGLGPRLAERIIADRAARGSFATLDDLARVPGIGPRTIERLRPFATAGPPPASLGD